MNLYEQLRDLRRSGQSPAQISEHLYYMFNITLSPTAINSIIRGAADTRQEKQYIPTRKWDQLTDIISFEEFENLYNPEKKRFMVSVLIEKYGFTDSDVKNYRYAYNQYPYIDWFNGKVTQQIFEADEYICQRCFFKDPRMETHHIMPGLGNHFENGIALCHACHYYIHLNKLLPKEFYNRSTWFDYIARYKVNENSRKFARRLTQDSAIPG